jgi:uncharacterized protein YkwD
VGIRFCRTAGAGRNSPWARRAVRCAALLAAAAAACAAPAVAAEPTCPHARTAPKHLTSTAADRALRCLINHERRRHGLRSVRAERHLQRAALRHARDMAEQDFFGHVSPGGATMQTRVARTGYLRRAHEWWLGEALAWGRDRNGSPAAILAELLTSPPHRAILLNPAFRDLGIGVARGAPRGEGSGALTIALDFGRRRT